MRYPNDYRIRIQNSATKCVSEWATSPFQMPCELVHLPNIHFKIIPYYRRFPMDSETAVRFLLLFYIICAVQLFHSLSV